ncbi:MAG: alpha/beta hydrolase fold domain-containing protein [Clostridia bacterium]|nr:alpha/beta hydrolase fold domain-containing protein [Clostridia bacterium]
MKKIIRTLGFLMFAALLLALAAAGLSRAVYGRSLRATLYEMKLRRQHAHPRTAEAEEARLNALRGEPEPVYAPPEGVGIAEWGGLRAFTLNEGGGDLTVLFLHGGAYINNLNAHQWRFLRRLSEGAGCAIVAPDYHLVPFGDCERAYADLTAFYIGWRSAHPGRRLLLMGDSAGGGLALGLAQALAARGEALPEGLILLSPWVDVSMDNPEAADLVSVEPLLHLDLMRVHGRWWAGALDVHDPRVSPLYGDMRGLPPVTLYCGTRELLYPDIHLCRDKLEAAGVDVTLRVGRGLNHDYPLMPIPEAEAAIHEILAMLKHCNPSPNGV